MIRLSSRSRLVLLVLSILLAGCNGSGVTEGFGRVHAVIEGQVFAEGANAPVAGAVLTFSVPVSGDCDDMTMAPTTTQPQEPVTTDADGRFSVDLQVHGHSPRNYCVFVQVGGTSVSRANVPFSSVTEIGVDTVVVDIQVP